MNLTWYIHRLRKMSWGEISKRIIERLIIKSAQIKYHNPKKWPYDRFADDEIQLLFHTLPGTYLKKDWAHYKIFNYEFDLTKPIDWYFTGNERTRWPNYYYAKINYQPGNPYGDVRINWELNRLQFLPVMSVSDQELAESIIMDWLDKNPYLHGPSYLSSMEVALRWTSIYWAVCLFKKPLKKSFINMLAGLAIASGTFIERHLSTHSSAGNHLIVEALGLAWIGKALEKEKIGQKWLVKARRILWEQINRQLNPDGTSQEQSFWYLGFVLDAFFHYLLIEDRKLIPGDVWCRVEKSIEFINEMVLPNGSFPDYGDRDDGFVFRIETAYNESPFPGLLNMGAILFDRPDWYRNSFYANQRFKFWSSGIPEAGVNRLGCSNQSMFTPKPVMQTYPDGGMTLMKWGKAKILVRHSHLGLEPTYSHGHADALSVLFSWDDVPVFIDLGSGQYNADQNIRNFFRSTIAHNTIEVDRTNQAKILGAFLWNDTYKTRLLYQKEKKPYPVVEARHSGYEKIGMTHTRKIEWPKMENIRIQDTISGSGRRRCRGTFHLGPCRQITMDCNNSLCFFDEFTLRISFPELFTIKIYKGSETPFMGWRSTIYGDWTPSFSIIFSFDVIEKINYEIDLEIKKTTFH